MACAYTEKLRIKWKDLPIKSLELEKMLFNNKIIQFNMYMYI